MEARNLRAQRAPPTETEIIVHRQHFESAIRIDGKLYRSNDATAIRKVRDRVAKLAVLMTPSNQSIKRRNLVRITLRLGSAEARPCNQGGFVMSAQRKQEER